MKKRLYLVRHGQTMFNRQHRIQGWCDSPLTELGQRQAAAVRDYFAQRGITFDHAYSSTSERCCDTLEIITSQPYTRTKGLKEMFYGELEGESERLCCKTREEARTFYLPFGGCSSDDVRDRMIATLRAIMEKEDHRSVLAVSHGASSFNFMCGVTGRTELPDGSRRTTNCCLYIYEYEDGRFTLLEYVPNPVTE